jgi:hypothetical protein
MGIDSGGVIPTNSAVTIPFPNADRRKKLRRASRPAPVSPRRHVLGMHAAHGLFLVLGNRKHLDRTICKAYASLDFR